MPSTVSSAFSDPDDFDTALREEGVLSLLVTARGPFRARVTQISLGEMCISAVDEHLPRIAFIAAPLDTVLIFFSIGNAAAPVFGGIRVKTGELIALYPGARFHFRTEDASHWGLVRLQADRLTSHGSASPVRHSLCREWLDVGDLRPVSTETCAAFTRRLSGWP